MPLSSSSSSSFRLFLHSIVALLVLLNVQKISSNVIKNKSKIKINNVLLLFADDAGLETSVYNNTICKTPHLEKLSKRSTIFTNAFTSVSSCSPSRASLLSGLPAHQNGMYGLHQSQHHFNSFDAVKSISHILNENGIRTGIIGKKHIGPENVYPFEFSYTEENYPILQVGRNITFIKELVQKFLYTNDERPFFLYIAFHDPHRCGHTNPEYGSFCEKFGNGEPNMGIIPDWKPVTYDPSEIQVPYFMPNTAKTREDIAAQYSTIGRLDTGIGLIMKELENYKLIENTLIIYASDNGPPFPNGRTNLYDPGIREPLLISNPYNTKSWATDVSVHVNLLDIMPTLLDWYGIDMPKYKLFGKNVQFTGKTLLPYTIQKMKHIISKPIFGSHNFHEITMFYPMRYIRTEHYKLIHNINYFSPFMIDQDFYLSPTFEDLLNRTHNSLPTHWNKNLSDYYYRPEWEMFNIVNDPHELINVYQNMKKDDICIKLKKSLRKWQKITNDPFVCSPHSVYENMGNYKIHPQCLPLFNKKL